MKYTWKGYLLHEYMGSLSCMVGKYRVFIIGSNVAVITLKWDVHDTRCSDSKLNRIENHVHLKLISHI